MKNQLFSIETNIPDHVKKVPIYSTTPFNTFSRSNREYMDYIQNRVEKYRSFFPIDAQIRDKGDMFVIKGDTELLEIYLTSDSFWWSDLRLADRVNPAFANQLPGNKKVKQLADDILDKLDLKSENLEFSGVAKNFINISTPADKKGKKFSTQVSANYVFKLGDLRVFGPGAKVSIAFSQKDRMVDFLFFFREAQEERMVKIISPEDALHIFMGDSRFKELNPKDGAKGVITGIKFGYYAFGPHIIQRFYFPVYQISAFLETKVFPKQELELYVIGTRITPKESKKINITGSSVYAKTFS